MSELHDAAAYATDPDLRPLLAAAIERAAVEIAYEPGDTAGHDKRKALASAVLANPMGLVDMFAWATSTNPTIVGKWIADDQDGAVGDMPFVLTTVWNALAGV